ncbi:MAG: transposase [Candidatus Rhabdochlamydia sp.]
MIYSYFLHPNYCSKIAKYCRESFVGTSLLNYKYHRISNGIAEKINNKIKTLKRRCYKFPA